MRNNSLIFVGAPRTPVRICNDSADRVTVMEEMLALILLAGLNPFATGKFRP